MLYCKSPLLMGLINIKINRIEKYENTFFLISYIKYMCLYNILRGDAMNKICPYCNTGYLINRYNMKTHINSIVCNKCNYEETSKDNNSKIIEAKHKLSIFSLIKNIKKDT